MICRCRKHPKRKKPGRLSTPQLLTQVENVSSPAKENRLVPPREGPHPNVGFGLGVNRRRRAGRAAPDAAEQTNQSAFVFGR